MLMGCLLGKLAGENAESYGAWLLIASALFFGLPHGGYDFWILTDASQRKNKSFITLIILLIVYFLVALLIIGIWFLLPNLSLIGFLILTVWHFGSGDAVWECEGKLDWILNSFGRGFILIFAPLTFFPAQSKVILSGLVADENSQVIVFLLNLAPYILVFGILLFLISSLGLKSKSSNLIPQKTRLIVLETFFLIIFFWLTSPLLAVTIYLIGVHSWRHLLRLDVYESNSNQFNNNSLWKIIYRFHHRTLPITIFSLFGIGLIFWLWQLQISNLSNYTSAYLILLSALTVPHAILISWTEIQFKNSN